KPCWTRGSRTSASTRWTRSASAPTRGSSPCITTSDPGPRETNERSWKTQADLDDAGRQLCDLLRRFDGILAAIVGPDLDELIDRQQPRHLNGPPRRPAEPRGRAAPGGTT